MKKDFTRDYATAAFRLYAALGKPTYEAASKRVYNKAIAKYDYINPAEAVTQAEIAVAKSTPVLLDILAVNETLAMLDKGGKLYICRALQAVYFIQPSKPLHKGDISSRVLRYSLSVPTDERTVYRWLKEGRDLFTALRGLRIDDGLRCQ